MSHFTVLLNKKHSRTAFHCGNELLDRYLHQQASQDMKRKLSVCFVREGTDNTIQGYYTLSNSAIAQLTVPPNLRKKLPPSYQTLPVTLIGRLAVDQMAQGTGLGALLLIDALKRSWEVSQSIGSFAVVVDPVDDGARRFYGKYGFLILPDSEKMFLPMQTLKALFEEPQK